jgi:hypothetical protein
MMTETSGTLIFVADGLEQNRQLVWIDDVDALGLDPERLDQFGKVDARRRVTIECRARCRGSSWPPVMPTARLSSSSTVTLPLVVDDVEQSLHAHVQEGRVANDGENAFVLVGFAAPLVEPERYAHRGAHRDRRCRAHSMGGRRPACSSRCRRKWSGCLHLRQRVIDAEVRAGHAHRRRPWKDRRHGAVGKAAGTPSPSRRAMAGFSTFGASSPCAAGCPCRVHGDAPRPSVRVSTSGSTSSTTTRVIDQAPPVRGSCRSAPG